MDFKELEKLAIEVKNLYDAKNVREGNKEWERDQYIQGFVADVGDLAKLSMMLGNYRNGEDVESKIKHEIADCLWSVIVIASELGIDLEQEFVENMKTLKERIR